MKTQDIINAIESRNDRSTWDKAVSLYACELLETYAENNGEDYEHSESVLLNGAQDWSSYSCGGSALIYDYELAERLCTPSELARKDGGRLSPNSRETWLDVQARALLQACALIGRTSRKIGKAA